MAKPSKTAEPGAAAAAAPGLVPARLEVVHVPVGDIRPNPWNPNRVAPEIMHKLREYLRKEGLVQPLVVRRMPDHLQLLGGFHRWTICKDDLGYTEVPVVILDVDEKRAKILTVNLNELSGDPVPHLMAQLVHDLSRDSSMDDLATMLPYNENELADFEELMKLPDGLAVFVEDQIAKEKAEAPTVLTFVVEEADVIEQALTHAVGKLEGKNRRGRSLALLARGYLAANEIPEDVPEETESPPADPAAAP